MIYPESDNPIYNYYYLTGADNNQTKKYINLNTLNLDFPLRFSHVLNSINEQLEISGTFNIGSIKNNYLAGYNYVALFRTSYSGYKLATDVYGPGRVGDNVYIPTYNPTSNGTIFTKFSAATIGNTYTHSLYLQNLLEVSEQFKVMLSGRYDYFDFERATADVENGKRKAINKTPLNKTKNQAFSYRIGAVYLPVSSLSVYGSLANYFYPYRNVYSASTVYVNSDGKRFYPEDGKEVFKPQTGYQAELGARYTLNSRLEATASAFYIVKNNETKTLYSGYADPEDGVTKSVTGQVGVSDSKGLELEVTYTPVSNATLSAGYGYTDARIKEISSISRLAEQGFISESVKNTVETQDGMRLAGIPKNTFFAAGHYGIAKGVLKGLTFGATVTYTDNVYRDVNKSVIYPAYWLTDLSASYTLKNNIRLRVNVNNVFNEKYYNQSLGTQIVPCNPANYLLTLSYSM
jgi:outer membrane receptor protein involved in Fe transport